MMRKVSYKNWKRSVNWIILFSLLTGLLFSSGEGVRLLPFPISNDKGVENSQTLVGKKTSFYNYSTHHSGSNLAKFNNKSQKTTKDLTGELPKIFRFDVVANLDLRLKNRSQFSIASYKSAHLVSLSDRAPPIV